MSSSIAIPNSSRSHRTAFPDFSTGSSSSSGSSYSTYSSTMGPPAPSESTITKEAKGKSKKVELQGSPDAERWASSPFRRRQSLMGKEIEKTEHIVVNVGSSEAPRLISCVTSSQGFDWNRSIFLPRYITGIEDESLEHRQDPIDDIVVTDEEAKDLLPQW